MPSIHKEYDVSREDLAKANPKELLEHIDNIKTDIKRLKEVKKYAVKNFKSTPKGTNTQLKDLQALLKEANKINEANIKREKKVDKASKKFVKNKDKLAKDAKKSLKNIDQDLRRYKHFLEGCKKSFDKGKKFKSATLKKNGKGIQ